MFFTIFVNPAKKAVKKLKILKSKIFLISLVSLVLLTVSGFILVSFVLPDKITITSDESANLAIPEELRGFLTVKNDQLFPVSDNTSKKLNSDDIQNYNTRVYVLNVVPIKSVDVAVVKNMLVIPGGETVGLTLKTDGIAVVGFAHFETKNGNVFSPGEEAGILPGDSIKKIDGKPVTKARAIEKILSEAQDTVKIEGTRKTETLFWTVNPATDKKDGTKKLGLWVRESVTGIGTATFYKDGCFGALGHSISDADTGEDVIISDGSLCNAEVVSVDKGKKGAPGSILGVFSGDDKGKITANTPCGVYGTITDVPQTPKVEIALKNKVRPGNATIRCDIGNGKVEEFKIEISRIVSTGNTPKNMIIKITDKKLLGKTGGVVQGMSGSPILQNGKLIGAVTHVFVNDPTRGYGIFIENMLAEAEKIK